MAYGPWKTYKKGDYTVYVYGDTNAEDNIFGIYSCALEKEYYRGYFHPTEKIQLHLEEDVPDLEIRLYYSGTGNLALHKVVICKDYSGATWAGLLLIGILLFWIVSLDDREWKEKNGIMQFVSLGIRVIKLICISCMIVVFTEELRRRIYTYVSAGTGVEVYWFLANVGIVFAVLFFCICVQGVWDSLRWQVGRFSIYWQLLSIITIASEGNHFSCRS